MQHDLILRGARIIDPSQNHDGIADVAFANGLVSGFGHGLPGGEGTEVREMNGAIVTPGSSTCTPTSIWGGTSLGIDADAFCRLSGVTTSVDTGSAGPGNFAGFRKHVIERAKPASSPICTSRSRASTASPRPSWSARARTCA